MCWAARAGRCCPDSIHPLGVWGWGGWCWWRRRRWRWLYNVCAEDARRRSRWGPGRAQSLVSGFVSGSCGALRPDCRCTWPAAPSGPQTGDKRGQRAAVRRRSCCQRPDIHQSINVVIDQPPDDRAGPALCADREEDDGPLDEEAAGASLPEFSPIL